MPEAVQTFNSPIETGVRALILLAESYPDQLDLQRILEFDYIMVHTGDVDGPPSIHPALPLRSGGRRPPDHERAQRAEHPSSRWLQQAIAQCGPSPRQPSSRFAQHPAHCGAAPAGHQLDARIRT